MQSDSEDQMLVSRCLDGDWAAFAFLVDKYKEVVHAYVYHRTSDHQGAQDISQEVFIKAYRNLGQLRKPHRFRSWLYTIVSNECSMWHRKHAKDRDQETPLEDVPVEELDELAVRNHSDEDIRQTVRNAMETLPDANRLALSLHYMSGLSVNEIAEFMGISPGNVKVRLHRARRQLGERLTNMINKQMKKEKLGSGFIMTMMNTIRNLPIPSMPKPRPIKWALPISLGMALLMGIIGFGISNGKDVSKDIPVLKFTKEPVKVSLVHEELDAKGNEEYELIAINTEDSVAPEAEGSSRKEIVVRKVGFDRGGIPSPDGLYISFANRDGNLAILNLTTGEIRNLTDEGNWEGAQRHAMSSTWSPDGKQIAYEWSGENMELRIVGLDGAKPRILHPGEESKEPIYGCYDWSQDGKYILSWLRRTQGIMLISVDDGSIKILKSPVPQPYGMSLSPDGRYVVYDCPVKEHEDLRDLFILATDGSGQETRLTEHPANDYYPAWSPDGNGIVFASNRDPGGGEGLWFIQVDDGKPGGEARMIKKEAGDIRTRGFTDNGSLFYTTETTWSDIYVTSVDMETGEILSQPELIPLAGMLNIMPAWSPDGKNLAYLSERRAPGSFRSRAVLLSRSMETGEEREFCPVTSIGKQLRWSPDGGSILIEDRYNLHLLDVQTGHITHNITEDTREVIWHPVWSPDGKTLFFTRMRHAKDDWPCRMMALDLATREERELYSGNSPRMFLAVSPDGRQLAFIDNDEAIKVIPTEGGEPHTLITSDDLNLPGPVMDYMPHSRGHRMGDTYCL